MINQNKMESNSDAGDAGESMMTYGDVLNAVQHGEDPTKIAAQVQRFLQQNPNLSGATKTEITLAVDKRNEAERQKCNHRRRMGLNPNYNSREGPWLQLNLNITNTGGALMNYADVLYSVQHCKNPITIAAQVRLFLQRNPHLSMTKKRAIASAVEERNMWQELFGDPDEKRMRLDLDQNLHEKRPWIQLNIPMPTTNSHNPTNPMAKGNPRPPAVGMLKCVFLSRQSLRKIERACAAADGGGFARLRKLLLGCLVRVNVQDEYLVAEINNVEDHMRYGRNVHFDRRLFLQPFGYYEFKYVSNHSPTEAEMQLWVQKRKLPLPTLTFYCNKIAKLKPILGDLMLIQFSVERTALNLNGPTTGQPNGEGTSAGTSGRQAQQNSADDNENLDVSEIVHSQETLIQSLLPSEQFLRILAVRNKFPLRVDIIYGCLVAYRILGDPGNRVYISEIAKIDDHSVQFKHRPTAVEFADLLPVVEERDVVEDVFGDWLEEMENWNEPLPQLQKLATKLRTAMDMIKLTLPPAEAHPLDKLMSTKQED